MIEKVSPLMELFDKKFYQGKSTFNILNKNFRTKKALELNDNLIFLNIYLDLLNRIHFREERLQFQLFEPFRPIHKALKRIQHYKLVQVALEHESSTHQTSYNTYKKFLIGEKKALYAEVYETLFTAPLDIWESLYGSMSDYVRDNDPLQIDTASLQLVNEEI